MKSPDKVQEHINALSERLDKAVKDAETLSKSGNFLNASDRYTDSYVYQSIINTLKWVLADGDN